MLLIIFSKFLKIVKYFNIIILLNFSTCSFVLHIVSSKLDTNKTIIQQLTTNYGNIVK